MTGDAFFFCLEVAVSRTFLLTFLPGSVLEPYMTSCDTLNTREEALVLFV